MPQRPADVNLSFSERIVLTKKVYAWKVAMDLHEVESIAKPQELVEARADNLVIELGKNKTSPGSMQVSLSSN